VNDESLPTASLRSATPKKKFVAFWIFSAAEAVKTKFIFD